MKKNDFIAVACLLALMFLWPIFDRHVLKPIFPPAPTPVPTATPVEQAPVDALPAETALEALPEASEVSPALPAELPDVPEQFVELRNERLSVRLTNLGAGVARAKLFDYEDTLADKKEGSGRKKELDFADAPALVYDLPSVGATRGFSIIASNETSVVFERRVNASVSLQRTITLTEGYVLEVQDRWTNHGEVDTAIPSQPIWLGRMHILPGISQRLGPFLGVDALHSEGRMEHYVKQIRKAVLKATEPEITFQPEGGGVEWFTAKNKFFTQVLTVGALEQAEGAETLLIRAARGADKKTPIRSLASGARLGSLHLPSGQSVTRDMTYFVGPMVMQDLRALGQGQEQAIDFHLFAFLQPFAKWLMAALTWIYGIIGNYGVSIIVLTVLVRTLMWPLTHKGTKSMKRMQEFAPEMKAIRDKYKDNPQQMNAAMGQFYRDHKINPLAGCLPMLVQMPVFLGLYGMLRVAVELRFEKFLWIADLSEAENIFMLAGDIGFNLLPLTMGATMYLQQKMMPTQMDPTQQKIMQFMPVMITVVCYSMPAGLLLYWTTSNIISIFQTHYTHKAISEPAKDAGKGKKPAPAKKGKAKS